MNRTVVSIFAFLFATMMTALAEWSSSDSARLQNIDSTVWDIYSTSGDIEAALSTVNSRLYTSELLHGSEVQLLREVTNLLRRAGGGDVLAGNPWWSTNSQFMTYISLDASGLPTSNTEINKVFPQRSGANTASFPEFMSFWSVNLANPSRAGFNASTKSNAKTLYSTDAWRKLWGVDRMPTSASGQFTRFTWFDWMAEVQKMQYDASISNLVLQSTSGTNELARWDSETGASSVDDEEPTHGSLPSLTLTQSDVDMSGSVALVDVNASGWAPSLTGADPSFTIYPGATVGGVTVSPVVASIALPDWVTRVIHGVAVFVWGVMFVASLIALGRHEFDFWSTLGGSAS